jgi:sporulation integral membrane protein YtvI
MTFYTNHKNAIDRAAFFITVTVIIFVFFKFLFPYFSPFFFGILIALAMEPLINRLTESLKFKRWMASVLCLLLLIAAVGSLGTWIVTRFVRQTMAFVEAAPLYAEMFINLIDEINSWLDNWTDYSFPDMREAMVSGMANFFGSGVRDQGLRLVSNVPDFFINLILMLVSAFFFMKDKPVLMAAAKKRCPVWLKNHLLIIRRGLLKAAGGYLKAQFILMSIVGILAIGGLLILRNPYALMIGLIMAVLDFLPVVGSGSVLIPWALFHIVTGDMHQAMGLLALYGVITITRQVMEPKVMGEQIGIHPLTSLVSVFIGYKVFGVAGILIGPAIVMVGIAIFAEKKVYS